MNGFTPEYAAEMEQKLDDRWMPLHKNNPELTSVDTSHLLCNYSLAIGRSLRNNTHVTSLTLALPILFGCGIHFTLLKFIRTSNSLRKISLVSGHYSYSFATQPFSHLHFADPNRMALALLQALADNPNIRERDVGCQILTKALLVVAGQYPNSPLS
jgi:hypothetical protein